MSTIELRAVSVVRGGVSVLDNVSLAAEPGALVGVIGPNGAGKTTLLRVMSGEVLPTSGTTRINGADPSHVPLQSLALIRAYLGPHRDSDVLFAARDVVEMGRHPHRASSPDSADRHPVVDAALADVDATHLGDRSFGTLSSGEQQRVAIARVLAQETPAILLDEPTSALDISHQDMVMQRLRRAARAGGVVVAVLHDLNLAAAWADSVVLLDAGRVIAAGTPADVMTAERLTATYRHPMIVMPHPTRDCPLILSTPDAQDVP